MFLFRFSFCLVVALVLNTTRVCAVTFHVGANKPLHTIKQALQKASNNDTIMVHAGTYAEGNITIDKPITLLGVDRPVLNGTFKYEILSVKSSHVTIAGFRLINTGYSSMEDIAAIRMYGVHHIVVRDNIIDGAFFGIYFTNARYCLVQGNTLTGPAREQYNVGNGIHLWKSSHVRILNNNISAHRDGIYFEFVKHTVIAFNHSEKNHRYGLHFMFSDSDYYYNNTFVNNGAGVAVMYSKCVNMLKNRFIHNWGGSAYGLLLKDIRDSHIMGNSFDKNTVGIHAEGCSRSLFFANSFRDNGYAIRLQANCDDNRFSFNNFVLNTFDLVTNGYTILNELSYNYWDRYTGFDLTHDGVGDQPYHPMSMFSAIVENSPVTVIFLKSFLANTLDMLEKLIPSLTPEQLLDPHPLIKKHHT